METTLYDPSSPPGYGPARVPTSRPFLPRPLARSVVGAAVLLGITGDALLREPPAGPAFGVWISLVALNAIALLWRTERAVARETVLWLCTAVLFSLGLAWRNSGTLQAFDTLAVIGCLGMAAISARDSGAALFARRLRDTFFTGLDVVGGVLVGVLPLVLRDSLASGDGSRVVGRFQSLLRPAIIAGLALLIFGSLLRGADPIFASVIAIPRFDVGMVISHVVLTGFLAWVFAGWARTALVTGPRRHRADAPLPIQLGAADITAALGTLAVLFAAFIATQFGWFFGGEPFLRARTGLTAAMYARQGFFQMVWVVLLVVPVLVGTRAALAPGRELEQRHTLLSLPVVVLLGAIIVSATLRMKMYIHFYGLTTERFYPLVFMMWLAVVVGWLALTVLRGWGRPFVAGTVISGLVTLLTLNVVDPDTIVARVNIARALRLSPSGQPALDLVHLSRLSGGGVELATSALLASPSTSAGGDTGGSGLDSQRCMAARLLLGNWGPTSRVRQRLQKDGAWRFWNRDDARAMRVVSKNSRAVDAIQHASCPAVRQQRTPQDATGNSRI